MEDSENKKSEVEVDGLGLIDVASEDDNLLFSSFLDPTGYEFSETDEADKCLKDDKDLNFMRDTHFCDDGTLVSSIEEKEEVLQPHESPEPEKVMKKGKYNLRKSLAWNNEFFTNEGVLEPEELSSMMESKHKSGEKALPTIQEDINRSTESISTLLSDCTVENSQEFLLFDDVRSSIPRTAKVSDAETHGKNNELGATEIAIIPKTDEGDKCLKDDKDLNFMRDIHCCDDEILVSSTEEKEEVLQPHESPEPEKVMTKEKYNLRKSLAWNNAFFTNEGVLEPEEISSMIESNNKSEKKALPTIQEDINRSTESISTLLSDCSVENNQEFVLFDDVRASIHRTAKASDAATHGKNNELGAKEVAIIPTSGAVDVLASEENTKPKASLRNPSIRAQGLGKATKQPVAPNGLSKGRPLSASMNSASLDLSKAKQEKDSKLLADKEPQGPRIPISQRTKPVFPKPGVPVKPALRSSAASKNEMTSSCSSLESCSSASSTASHKSSVDPTKKRNNDSSSRLASQLLTNRSTSRGIMGQPRISTHPTNKTSKSKLSSRLPSATPISDSSLQSSQASATCKIANGTQKTVSGEKGPQNDNSEQSVKPLRISKDVSVGQADDKEDTKRVSAVTDGLVPQASMKPSGLRVPSLNIGFFDGASHGSACANKKSGMSQPEKSSRQESSNQNPKASSRLVSDSPPRLTNKLYSKINAEEQLEAEG